MHLHGAVVAITGAGSGIGRALALACQSRGARVSICDLDEVGLAQTHSMLGSQVHAQVVDVSDRAQVRAYAASVAEHFGMVNVIINNAGVTYSGPITDVEYDDFEWLMGINFWGVVYGTKEFLPYLIESGSGHIVNLSSLFGLVSVPTQAAYNSAKFAVRGFTESVRQDLIVAGLPVAVTCVHPGGVKTGIARNGRSTQGQDHHANSRRFEEELARLTPDQAAQIIVKAIERDKPRVLVGIDAHILHNLAKFLGARYQGLYAKVASRSN